MRKITLLLIFSFLLTFLSFSYPVKRTPALVRVYDKVDVRNLIKFGVDIDRVSFKNGFAIVYVNDKELNKLKENGFEAYRIEDRAEEQWKKYHELGLKSGNPLDAYHTYDELTTEMQNIANAHPDICHLYSAGKSVQNRDLWVMKISDNVNTEEYEPEFKYISTMHGDEPVGMEMCLNLINYLVDNYGTDETVTNLVDNTEIYIMPLMNPDGYVLHQRENADNQDLNRSFPDRVDDPNNTPDGRPIEVQDIMNFFSPRRPVLSANFHTGALVVNYPWDDDPNISSGSYAACPDDDEFITLSETYSQYNSPMWNSSEFEHGITNGNNWYAVSGGMQDWNYVWLGDMEVTIELSDDKWPDASALPGLWDDNRESMLHFMDMCHKGVKGIVTDSSTGNPISATITVDDRGMKFYTDPDVGDYHRYLKPGTYTLHFTAEGYASKDVQVTVNDGDATEVNVQMDPQGDTVMESYQLQEYDGNGDNYIDPGETWDLLITVKNNGNAASHNVSGTISANSSNVTILQNGYSYGVINPGESETSTVGSFRFKVNSDVDCGGEINLTFTVNSDEGADNDNITETIGESITNSYDSSDVPKDIPDNDSNGVDSTLQVNDSEVIDGLVVHINITHTYVGDLIIKLTSPSGTTATLWNREGGSDSDINQDFNVDDFNGENAQGNWTLNVSDNASSDTGTLNSWTVNVNTATCNPYTPTSSGDVNNDGNVNINDAILLANYLASNVGDSGVNLSNSDVDSNGVINAVDLCLLLNQINNQ